MYKLYKLYNVQTVQTVQIASVWAGDYFLMKLHLQIVNMLNNKWTISDVREARVWEGNGEGVKKINKLLIC